MDLDLCLFDRLIAHTEPMSRGAKLRIIYEESVDERHPAETSLLSCSIPTGSRSEPAAAQAFLEGLLPEGRALESMAARLQGVRLDLDGSPAHPYDAVNLLGEYGRECAGAISVVPRGEPAPGREAKYQPLAADEIARMIGDLPARPLGVDVTRDIRMSLAGAQPKLLLAHLAGRWHDPVGGAASTHILKPTGRWPLSSDNECVVMTLAKQVGLTDRDVWVETFDGRRAFVAQRFDRVVEAVLVRRIHQEDLCQATKTRPRDKYSFGALSVKARLLIRDKSSDPIRDSRELFKQLAFRAMVGDEDGHAKNYGLTLIDGRVSLSPLYDSLTTLVYGELSGNLGTPIGSRTNLAEVDMDALLEEARAFRLGEEEAHEVLASLAQNLVEAVDHLDPNLADERAMDAVTAIVRTRVRRLLDGERMGGVERRWRLDDSSGRRRGENLDKATLSDDAAQRLAAGRTDTRPLAGAPAGVQRT